jgi:hypothetical protein
MTEKEKLKERIEGSYNELQELVQNLGDDGLRVTGSDGWAVKDHLIHLGAWELSLLGLLEGRDRVAAMGVPGVERETEAINRAVWTLHRNKTPQEAVAFFAGTHAQLMSALDKLSYDDLQLPYSHYQSEIIGVEGVDRPVVGWVAGNTYEHYEEHIPWMTSLVAERS